MAPIIPVKMTMTAVSDGSPPNCSEIPIATGAVTDFGAIDIIEMVSAPKNQAIDTALSANVSETLNTDYITVAKQR